MEEAAQADRVIVMEAGKIALQGTPRDVFKQAERLHELQLDVPPITRLAQAIHARHPEFPDEIYSVDAFVAAAGAQFRDKSMSGPMLDGAHLTNNGEAIIRAEHQTH
jgi:ABC-type glutathione transport system ATPase component